MQKIILDQETLQKFMRYRPSLKETANFFNVSEDTVERRIRDWENCSFKDFKSRYSRDVKNKLIDKALEMAAQGHPTMLIFCLKNCCGWSDKVELESTDDKPTVIRVAYSENDIRNYKR